MKNKYKKFLASLVKLEPSDNITVTRTELREAKLANPNDPQLTYNLGSNRIERRRELKNDRYSRAHGQDDKRTIINNRGNAGQRVFEKMAYFYLSLNGRKQR